MNHEFSVEEIKVAARAARIYCQDFSEEKFGSLMEFARRVDESGYLDTVRGIHRLEVEHNVPVTKLLDACEELLERNKELERRVNDSESRLEGLGELINQKQQKYDQLQKAATEAEETLTETVARRKKEEKQLSAFQKRAESEKRRIGKEVEDMHQAAKITREEVIAAGQMKAEVEKHSFTLELALGLSGEFAGYENAKERLATGLKKYGTLTRYLKELEEWGEGRRATLLSEMSHLETQNKQLEDELLKLQASVSQLRSDEAGEQEMRRFHRRFGGLGGVLEQLAKWKGIYPLRCNNPVYAVAKPFNPSAGCARVWTDKPVSPKCPYCGLNTLVCDEEVYNALGMPVGIPITIILGE